MFFHISHWYIFVICGQAFAEILWAEMLFIFRKYFVAVKWNKSGWIVIVRFPCCVLSYFSLVFVVEHSRRWWLHTGVVKCSSFQGWDCRPAEMAVFSRFWPFLVQFFIVTHIYGQTMYILQKNCPQTSFPGGKEAPNILHGGKMLAPHFKDEIASLQKWPFLAGFWPFLEQFFYYDSYL